MIQQGAGKYPPVSTPAPVAVIREYRGSFKDAYIGAPVSRWTSAIYWERESARPIVKFTNLGIQCGKGPVDLTFTADKG